MRKYNHLFIIDPIETLNLELDTTLRYAHQLQLLGDSVSFATPDNLSLSSKCGATCLASEAKSLDITQNSLSLGEVKGMNLKDFSAIHMRKDPPFDMDYVSWTWILDVVAKDVPVFNHPESLRNFNEKLSILSFPEYIDPVLISSQSVEIIKFIRNTPLARGIIKPLDLFGGRGVSKIDLNEPNSEDKATDLINDITNSGNRLILAQPFNEEIKNGEIRAFSAFGQPLAWCLKRPKPGSYLANTREGAILEEFQPPSEIVEMVKSVSMDLLEKQIYFVGFDIIGDRISELNITSPRLLLAGNDLDSENEIYLQMAELTKSFLGS